MSLAHLRTEIQSAVAAAIDKRETLYEVGDKIVWDKPKAALCSKTTELILLAWKRAKTVKGVDRQVEAERAVAAALEGKDRLYKSDEHLTLDDEKNAFCQKTVGFAEKALKRCTTHEKKAGRAEKAPKPAPQVRRPKEGNGNGKAMLGMIGRPTKELVKEEGE